MPLEDELAGEAGTQIETLEVLLGIFSRLINEALEDLRSIVLAAGRQILVKTDFLLTIGVGNL